MARRDRRIAELLKQRRVLRRQLQVLQQVLQREVAALTEEMDRARQANRGLSHAAELVVRVEDPRPPGSGGSCPAPWCPPSTAT